MEGWTYELRINLYAGAEFGLGGVAISFEIGFGADLNLGLSQDLPRDMGKCERRTLPSIWVFSRSYSVGVGRAEHEAEVKRIAAVEKRVNFMIGDARMQTVLV